jgi:raffinose/stachyose/melibiose transport system permease protein
MFPLVRWLRIVGNGIGIPLLGTSQGIVFAYLGFGCSMSVFILHGFIKGVPLELEEAATIDGCSRMHMFFAVVLPLMRPVMATIAVLNALWVWGEFLVAFLVYGTKQPMTLPVSQQYFYGTYSSQWNLILAGFVISTVPIVIFYIAMQKNIVMGIAAGAVKG